MHVGVLIKSYKPLIGIPIKQGFLLVAHMAHMALPGTFKACFLTQDASTKSERTGYTLSILA